MARRKRYRPVKPTLSYNNPKFGKDLSLLEATVSGQVLTLTLDQPFTLKGIPGFTVDHPADAVVVSAAVNGDPTKCDVSFSDALASATVVMIPPRDPALRSRTGGFVSVEQFPVT